MNLDTKTAPGRFSRRALLRHSILATLLIGGGVLALRRKNNASCKIQRSCSYCEFVSTCALRSGPERKETP